MVIAKGAPSNANETAHLCLRRTSNAIATIAHAAWINGTQMTAFDTHPGALAPAPPMTNHKKQTNELRQM